MMSKGDFVKIGRALQDAQAAGHIVSPLLLEKLADTFQDINPAFKRGRWLDFVAGKVGPNGGAIKETPKPCEVCGKTGNDAKACRFEKACSCWRNVPCKAVR